MEQNINNKRRKKIDSKELEIATPGYANGISLHLQNLIEKGENRSLNHKEKQQIINEAAKHFGDFLIALGVDWKNDPNSMETPMRVAKAYVNDLWKSRYEIADDITSFPSDGYNGIVLEKDIQLVSMCSHHHQAILGKVHIAYVPGDNKEVIGLSKLNRIVETFARRGAIQEQLTMAIHNAVSKVVLGNKGVMVVVHSNHNCVSCRGVKHWGANMVTSEVSGVFEDHTKTAKSEVLSLINMKIDSFK